jgi:hypothetical protein
MIQTMESRIFNLIKEAVLLEFNFVVGATGAVGTTKGGGISSIERLGVGTYRVNLDRTYNRLLSSWGGVIAPTTGSPVAAGSLVATTTYRITTLGTSDFTAVGAKKNVVGEVFVASGTTTGTGTCTAMGVSSAVDFQLCTAIPDNASHWVFQCVDKDGAVVDPTSGSVFAGVALLRKSSVKGQGE